MAAPPSPPTLASRSRDPRNTLERADDDELSRERTKFQMLVRFRVETVASRVYDGQPRTAFTGDVDKSRGPRV
jgi:hypothetical protein